MRFACFSGMVEAVAACGYAMILAIASSAALQVFSVACGFKCYCLQNGCMNLE